MANQKIFDNAYKYIFSNKRIFYQLIDIRIPEKYIPSFEYYQIIQKDIADDVLLKIHNLASALIYLEKRRDEVGLKEAIESIIDLIGKENIIDLRMFSIWFNRIFGEKTNYEEISKISSIVEVKSMLQAVAEQIYERGIKEGMREGMREKALADARNLIKEGIAVEIIARCTGLPISEIEKL